MKREVSTYLWYVTFAAVPHTSEILGAFATREEAEALLAQQHAKFSIVQAPVVALAAPVPEWSDSYDARCTFCHTWPCICSRQ